MAQVYKHRCHMCSKEFDAYRRDQKYCSPNCRSLASYHRKAIEKGVSTRLLSKSEQKDVQTLRMISHEAADVVDRVASVCGVQIAQEVLDGYWSILAHFKAV